MLHVACARCLRPLHCTLRVYLAPCALYTCGVYEYLSLRYSGHGASHVLGCASHPARTIPDTCVHGLVARARAWCLVCCTPPPHRVLAGAFAWLDVLHILHGQSGPLCPWGCRLCSCRGFTPSALLCYMLHVACARCLRPPHCTPCVYLAVRTGCATHGRFGHFVRGMVSHKHQSPPMWCLLVPLGLCPWALAMAHGACVPAPRLHMLLASCYAHNTAGCVAVNRHTYCPARAWCVHRLHDYTLLCVLAPRSCLVITPFGVYTTCMTAHFVCADTTFMHGDFSLGEYTGCMTVHCCVYTCGTSFGAEPPSTALMSALLAHAWFVALHNLSDGQFCPRCVARTPCTALASLRQCYICSWPCVMYITLPTVLPAINTPIAGLVVRTWSR